VAAINKRREATLSGADEVVSPAEYYNIDAVLVIRYDLYDRSVSKLLSAGGHRM